MIQPSKISSIASFIFRNGLSGLIWSSFFVEQVILMGIDINLTDIEPDTIGEAFQLLHGVMRWMEENPETAGEILDQIEEYGGDA